MREKPFLHFVTQSSYLEFHEAMFHIWYDSNINQVDPDIEPQVCHSNREKDKNEIRQG